MKFAYVLALASTAAIFGCSSPQPAQVTLAPATTIAQGEMKLDALTARPMFEAKTVPSQAVANHWLPDPNKTPGSIFTTVEDSDVCIAGYSASVRNVPQSVKNAVYASYNMTPNVAPCPCEVDHLVSLELGGNNSQSNLWPQPYSGQWNAHMKDKLENYLHKQVCDGKMTLAEAQKEIASNWIAAYTKYGLDK